jgi:hypothetical protein
VVVCGVGPTIISDYVGVIGKISFTEIWSGVRYGPMSSYDYVRSSEKVYGESKIGLRYGPMSLYDFVRSSENFYGEFTGG